MRTVSQLEKERACDATRHQLTSHFGHRDQGKEDVERTSKLQPCRRERIASSSSDGERTSDELLPSRRLTVEGDTTRSRDNPWLGWTQPDRKRSTAERERGSLPWARNNSLPSLRYGASARGLLLAARIPPGPGRACFAIGPAPAVY